MGLFIKPKFRTADKVQVIDGEYVGKYGVISCQVDEGFWIIHFYTGNQAVIEEKLLERVPE